MVSKSLEINNEDVIATENLVKDTSEFSYEERSMHIGPIPSPETLEKYNLVD